jgi:acetyl-CoA C-acetyltransferase
MESMSNVPYYLPTARTGMRMGNQTVVDGMIQDGLWDVYNNFHMGTAAELCAREKKIDRAAQDAYAIESFKRALQAQKSGAFKDEIVAVEVPQRKGAAKRVELDEGPAKGDIEKIPSLKPAFQKDGTVTAANASKINDGAAALVVASEEKARQMGLAPIARIVAHAGFAQAPEWFTTAPVGAIQKLLKKTGLAVGDIDLFEINEAFAAVAMAAIRELSLDPARVNIRGGAVALGHPIGASGARILTTLIHALRKEGKKRGMAAICIGGGEATAMLVETALGVRRKG